MPSKFEAAPDPKSSGTPRPSVVCILLNWNGPRDTVACLNALRRLDYPEVSVIVVDNGSTDGSVAMIRHAFPEVVLLETGCNLGFAGGNNVGIRHALLREPDFIWLLNNDTEPRAAALSELVTKATSDPVLGAVGSLLVYAHDPGAVQAWGGGRVNLFVGMSEHALHPRDDAWFHYITAASVLLPLRALREVGLLDDGFFLYWEDADLCFRLRKAGWKLGVASGSVVLHREHASTGRNRRLIDRYVITSGILFLKKHSPLPWVSIPLFLSSRLLKRLLMGQFDRFSDVTRGIYDYFLPPKRG